jgi:hypothetical protein
VRDERRKSGNRSVLEGWNALHLPILSWKEHMSAFPELPTEAARLWGTEAYFESEEALAEELYCCGYAGPSKLSDEELNARLQKAQEAARRKVAGR